MALAAKLRGIPAYIVIPRNAPACKVDNVKRYGGHIIWSDVSIESRESVAKRVQEETGAILVHPFNNKNTIRYDFSVLSSFLLSCSVAMRKVCSYLKS